MAFYQLRVILGVQFSQHDFGRNFVLNEQLDLSLYQRIIVQNFIRWFIIVVWHLLFSCFLLFVSSNQLRSRLEYQLKAPKEHSLLQQFDSTHCCYSHLAKATQLLPSSTYLIRCHPISSSTASEYSGASSCCSCGLMRFYWSSQLQRCYCTVSLADCLDSDALQLNRQGPAWVFLRGLQRPTWADNFRL